MNKKTNILLICLALISSLVTTIAFNLIITNVYKFLYLKFNEVTMEQMNQILTQSPLYLGLISISNFMVILVMFFIAKKANRKILENDDLSKKKNTNIKLFVIGIILSILDMIIFCGFAVGTGLFEYEIGNQSQFTTGAIIEFLIAGAIYSIISGACEEVIHRGFIFKRLKEILPKYALAISSFIFMLTEVLGSEFRILDWFGVFLAGIFFGYLYISTSSLFTSAGFHSGVHFILLIVSKFQNIDFYSGPVFSIFNSGKDITIFNISVASPYGLTTAFINFVCIILLYLYNKKSQCRNK